MGKEIKLDKIEDFETTNRIINALMDRIDILNRLIDSKDMISTERIECVHSDLDQPIETNVKNNGNQELIQKLEKLEKEVEEKENEIKKELNDKLQLEKKLKEKDEEIQRLSEIKDCVENPYRMYLTYLNFNEDVREFFSGIICDDDITKFISSVATKECLNKFFDKIVDFIMQNHKDIEHNRQFNDAQRQVSKLFDFFYEIVSNNESNSDFERLEEKIGNEYDADNCARVGSASGEIKDILLQGYQINGDMCKRSIVLVN